MASGSNSDDETQHSEEAVSMTVEKERNEESQSFEQEEAKAKVSVIHHMEQETISRLSSPVFGNSVMETSQKEEDKSVQVKDQQEEDANGNDSVRASKKQDTKRPVKVSFPSSSTKSKAADKETKKLAVSKEKKKLTKKKSIVPNSSNNKSTKKLPTKRPTKQRSLRALPITTSHDNFFTTSANLLYSWDPLLLGRELGSAELNETLQTLHPLKQSPQLTSLQTLQIVNSLRTTTICPPDSSPLHKVIQTVRAIIALDFMDCVFIIHSPLHISWILL